MKIAVGVGWPFHKFPSSFLPFYLRREGENGESICGLTKEGDGGSNLLAIQNNCSVL